MNMHEVQCTTGTGSMHDIDDPPMSTTLICMTEMVSEDLA